MTTHLEVRGEITLQEEGKEKKTFKVGDRADVGANVKHEAWIGADVTDPAGQNVGIVLLEIMGGREGVSPVPGTPFHPDSNE